MKINKIKTLIFGLILLTFGAMGFSACEVSPSKQAISQLKTINGVVQFEVFGEMTGYTSKILYEKIQLMKIAGLTHMKIFIMSGGGNAFDCMGVIDVLQDAQKAGIHITTVGIGIVASAAVPVFLCGDTRIAGPDTIFMLHKIERPSYLDEDTKEIIELLEYQYQSFVVDHSNLTYEQVDKICGDYTWFTVKEAIQWGMVDQVL